MRIAAFLLGAALLAGCGADGRPETPTMQTVIGVGPGGVHGAAQVTVGQGPVTFTIGAGG